MQSLQAISLHTIGKIGFLVADRGLTSIGLVHMPVAAIANQKTLCSMSPAT
jgi:hypothetical protein